MTDDLELRLRQPAVFAEPAESQRCRLVMAKAADELARLRAENERLREALRPIADVDFLGPEPSYQDNDLVMISVGSVRRARAALKGSRHE